MESLHRPVMMKEVLQLLDPKPGETVVDCTIGLGGHSREILKMIDPGGRLIGIDRDSESLALSEARLKDISSSYSLIWDDFRNLDDIMSKLQINEADAIFLDLGVSSYQLENPERGFSIKSEGPLDMRMDRKSYISAYDLVNSLSEKELAHIIRNFGEERFSNRIARTLVEQRSKTPISSTEQLTSLILRCVPYRSRRSRIHPATRTFQAIRIAVNRELESLEIALDKIIDILKPGGRLCVIAFHSLEDRIVKHRLRFLAKEGAVKLITKKPLVASGSERIDNPRSRSAKLRVAEKI